MIVTLLHGLWFTAGTMSTTVTVKLRLEIAASAVEHEGGFLVGDRWDTEIDIVRSRAIG